MGKTLFVGLAALLLGALAGGALMQQRLQPSVAAAELARASLESELTRTRDQVEQLSALSQRLEAENAAQAASLQELRAEINRTLTAVAPAAPVDAGPDEEEIAALFDEVVEEEAGAGEWRRRGGEELSPEERAAQDERRQEWEQRRGEWAQQFRDNMYTTLAEAANQETNPEARERLTAMADYTEQMFELRDAMRATENEEEREALRAQLGELMGGMRDLSRQQQNYMLGNVARQYGVQSGQQHQFVQDLRTTMESPFFEMRGSRGGWGGGRR